MVAKANGVTFEGAMPVKQEVYFSLGDSTRFRARGRNMDMRTPASHCRFVA